MNIILKYFPVILLLFISANSYAAKHRVGIVFQNPELLNPYKDKLSHGFDNVFHINDADNGWEPFETMEEMNRYDRIDYAGQVFISKGIDTVTIYIILIKRHSVMQPIEMSGRYKRMEIDINGLWDTWVKKISDNIFSLYKNDEIVYPCIRIIHPETTSSGMRNIYKSIKKNLEDTLKKNNNYIYYFESGPAAINDVAELLDREKTTIIGQLNSGKTVMKYWYALSVNSPWIKIPISASNPDSIGALVSNQFMKELNTMPKH